MSKQWTELIPPNWPPDILCQVKTRRGFLRAGPLCNATIWPLRHRHYRYIRGR